MVFYDIGTSGKDSWQQGQGKVGFRVGRFIVARQGNLMRLTYLVGVIKRNLRGGSFSASGGIEAVGLVALKKDSFGMINALISGPKNKNPKDPGYAPAVLFPTCSDEPLKKGGFGAQ